MSRRNKPPNRHGCKPDEDVCVEHDLPLECKHGCAEASQHKCQVLVCSGCGEPLPDGYEHDAPVDCRTSSNNETALTRAEYAGVKP